MTAYRMVGGPRAGTTTEVRDVVSVIRGPVSVFDDETLMIRPGWPQDREYVRVRRKTGEVVFEWHRHGWQSPNVRVIKAAVLTAADKLGEVMG